jgi:tetratricopeptide (TPR) repeat protein
MLYAVAALVLAVPAIAAADKKIDDAVAKAESQIAKGRNDDAEKTLEKLVQQVPTAEAHAERARIQLRLGNTDGAGLSASEAAKLLPTASGESKARALATLALVDLERGSGKDAVTHVQEASTLSATPATLAILARAQARVGDPAALETAKKAVEAGAQVAAAHEAMGHALLATQRAEEAAASFRKALELDVKRSSARVGLASALVAMGKPAEAVTEARKASEEDPRSGEAFAVLGTAIMAAAPEEPKAREAAWGDAIAQAQQGAFVSPRNPVVLFAVGQLFEAGGNLDQAAKTYKTALATDPGYAQAQLALLEIEARKGDVAAALPRVDEMIRQQPQNAALQFMKGKMLARRGDWDQALDPLQKAAAGMANVAEVHALLGTAYQYNGQSDDALAAYKKAVALAPGNMDYRTTYGLLLGLNKEYAPAIAELQKVTGSAGYKDAAGWVNLGWVLRNVEPPRAAESASAYQKALQLDPKNAQAALGLGWAHLTGQQYDQAIAAFNKAIELDKTTAGEAYNGIGWSHFFKKDITQAKATAEKAKAAGRPVASLLQNIDRFEKGQQAAENARAEFLKSQREEGSQADVGSLGSQLMRGGPGAIAAARKLGSMGAPAVQYLVYYAVNGRDWSARQASIVSLGNIGGAARSTCAQLKSIAGGNPYGGNLTATKEEMENEARFEDLRRAAKGAIGKIGC